MMPHNYAPEHLKKWKEQLLQASVHTARYTYVHECLKKKLVIEANGTCNTINLCKSQPQISFCKQRNQHPKKNHSYKEKPERRIPFYLKRSTERNTNIYNKLLGNTAFVYKREFCNPSNRKLFHHVKHGFYNMDCNGNEQIKKENRNKRSCHEHFIFKYNESK